MGRSPMCRDRKVLPGILRSWSLSLTLAAIFAQTLYADEKSTSDAAPEPARAIRPLADDFVIVYESPDPQNLYAFSPGITRLPTGRLVATMDQGGPGAESLPHIHRDGRLWRGRIYTSDDKGRTWQFQSDAPLHHARPFVAGSALYVLGHDGRLVVVRSDDDGETWSKPALLTESSGWHQAPCNVWYTNGKIYLVMERKTDRAFEGWPVAVLAPVVMAARVTDDLTKPASWTFSNEFCFRDATKQAGTPRGIGAPFFTVGVTAPGAPDSRHMREIGWLETNLVQFTDRDHVWYDPHGRTFHLWMRAHTGTTNLACVARVVETPAGTLEVSTQAAPSGEPMLYVPCPGGHMKFHILHDEKSGLFWLLSSQSTDSMMRPDRLPANRYNLPNNERHRLVLHFSKNCVDWCFAGLVCNSGVSGQDRNYASMAIDGNDLVVLSRSGDHRAKRSHDGNLITFHRINNFRQLVY